MKGKIAKSILGTLVFIMSFSLIVCKTGIEEIEPVTLPITDGGGNDYFEPVSLTRGALRAVTIPASTSTPIILASYTDNVNNYYLIDVGSIQSIYVSTIMEAYYNGMTPISLSRSIINQTTVTNALTDTISNSITISSTTTHKVDIKGKWENSFPFLGKFSVELGYQWGTSQTDSNTSTRSTTTSVSTVQSTGESLTTSLTIGENGEPKGNYRYALYGVCDIYFVVTTDKDNQQLLEWETLACLRDGSFFPHLDFSPELPPNFDNSPVGNEITFAEDFYKTLPTPTDTQPLPPVFLWNGWTDWNMIRTSEYTLTSYATDAAFINPYDAIRFDSFDFVEYDAHYNPTTKQIYLNEMIQRGYKTVSFYIQLEVKSSMPLVNSTGQLLLFNSPLPVTSHEIASTSFSGYYYNSWTKLNESTISFKHIPIGDFVNNEFFIRYKKGGNYSFYNRNLKIQLVFLK